MRVITSGVAQIVPEADLRKKLERGVPLNIKLGVDPTSPDLHLGHAVPLRKMRQFQDLGHKVTLIIGNGTAMIGDPSGKNSTRPQLSQEQVEANAATYVSQAMKILDPEKTTIVHNGDWILSLDLKGMAMPARPRWYRTGVRRCSPAAPACRSRCSPGSRPARPGRPDPGWPAKRSRASCP